MKDQYNNEVGTLVLIPCFGNRTVAEIMRIVNNDWYDVLLNQGDSEPTTYLMCPILPIKDLIDETNCEFFIRDTGEVSEELGGTLIQVLKVNDVLKRWSIEDGFYHA